MHNLYQVRNMSIGEYGATYRKATELCYEISLNDNNDNINKGNVIKMIEKIRVYMSLV